MKPSGKYFYDEQPDSNVNLQSAISKQIFLTERKNARVDDVCEKEDDGAADAGLAAQVGVDDGEAPDQAD